MRSIFLFMMVSVDGYFEGPDHDLSWHNVEAEFQAFAIEQLGSTGVLLFGHRTYDMMAAFWPGEGGAEDPATAKFMNELPKFVVAHTPFAPAWGNTKVVNTDVFAAVRALKAEHGKDIAIFGSNNLCVSLMQEGLVDEFRIMVNPVALGKGTPLFAGFPKRASFMRASTREFRSGNVLNIYRPV